MVKAYNIFLTLPHWTLEARSVSKMQEKFTWVFENLSSFQDEKYRHSPPFTAGGCNWRLCAYPGGAMKDGSYVDGLFVDLYYAPGSLFIGKGREVKYRITLVNVNPQYNKVIGEECFMDCKSLSRFVDFLALDQLRNKLEGFLVDDRLTIVAEVNVLPAIVVPLEPVKMVASLNSKEASVKGDSPCHQVAQETDNAASQEKLNNDDGTDDDYDVVASEESSDDDYDDDDDDASEESSDDDASQEDADDDASSPVVNDDGGGGISPLNQMNALGINTATGGGKETMDVNGFEVFSSQVESVSYIFKRHPDLAIYFRPKNQHIRRAYMDALLSLIEMMCQSPEKLSENDLSNAEDTLVDLTDAGFKVDWLETKLYEICKKKKMEQGSKARLETMEEQLQKLKEMFLDLESQLHKEKVEALAARAPLSFNDVVC
ncbi:PREDICTED: MATH domain and coiled-coil domain-containing protein At3g58440-like [Camelina sativa]|uniref:MATH domain and coiled-coil domain-containing protein At3g58440-like n=1 Tax=Camelina sativa TaxID=90675 RepID=A0ABM1RSE8_CAMSA|nr:PREDICTED: MATH domain and coiled-coil domain-containing protein At3g58440-like [Camelina sativa]